MKNFRTLYYFELKKILSRKIVWIMVVGALLFMVLMESLLILTEHVEVEGKYISLYDKVQEMRQLSKKHDNRPIDDTLLSEMQEAYTKQENTLAYAAVYEYVAMFGDALELKEQDLYDLKEIRQQMTMKDLKLSEKEKEYWKEKESMVQKPICNSYVEGGYRMWASFYSISILLPLLLAVCLSNLFSEEHKRRTDQLLLCTKEGRKQVYYAKLAAGMSFGLACAFLLMLATLLALYWYGAGGIDAPIQLVVGLTAYSWTIKEAIAIYAGLCCLTSLLLSVAAMFFSEWFRSASAVMAVMVIGMFAGIVQFIPFGWRVLSQLQGWLPQNMMGDLTGVMDFRLIPWFGGYLNKYQFVPWLYFLVTLLLAAVGKQLYKNYQVKGR